jgi:hypothetical protein
MRIRRSCALSAIGVPADFPAMTTHSKDAPAIFLQNGFTQLFLLYPLNPVDAAASSNKTVTLRFQVDTSRRHNAFSPPKGEDSLPLRLLQDQLIAMCVVETTAATQSGISSWKTKPCRLLLRLLVGVPRPAAKMTLLAFSETD